jgi:site-specific DNA-methyltransferase (adenine-specific)
MAYSVLSTEYRVHRKGVLMTSPHGLELDRVHQGDCLDLLPRLANGSIDLAFADPPFNIG